MPRPAQGKKIFVSHKPLLHSLTGMPAESELAQLQSQQDDLLL